MKPAMLQPCHGLPAVLGALLLATAAGLGPSAALHTYAEADLALGEKLISEHACTACHVRKVGGDGSAIYRPQGPHQQPRRAAGMVDYCSTELNLGLFPEEVMARWPPCCSATTTASRRSPAR
jgi:hypothetical protein